MAYVATPDCFSTFHIVDKTKALLNAVIVLKSVITGDIIESLCTLLTLLWQFIHSMQALPSYWYTRPPCNYLLTVNTRSAVNASCLDTMHALS